MEKKTLNGILDLVKTEEFKNKLKENILFVSAVIDRTLQKDKMVNVFGWDFEVVNKMEQEYIRFLALTKTIKDFGVDFKIIPNLYIDEFWHNHILDTQQYHKDCNVIFNELLHHFPYYGILGEEDNKNWLQHSQVCQKVWNECFGEDLYGNLYSDEDGYKLYKELYKKLSENYNLSGSARCRTACKPQLCP